MHSFQLLEFAFPSHSLFGTELGGSPGSHRHFHTILPISLWVNPASFLVFVCPLPATLAENNLLFLNVHISVGNQDIILPWFFSNITDHFFSISFANSFPSYQSLNVEEHQVSSLWTLALSVISLSSTAVNYAQLSSLSWIPVLYIQVILSTTSLGCLIDISKLPYPKLNC